MITHIKLVSLECSNLVSELGSAHMRVPISDQMLTSRHALFEDGQIRDGYILHLDQHLDRLFGGITKIRLSEKMKRL